MSAPATATVTNERSTMVRSDNLPLVPDVLVFKAKDSAKAAASCASCAPVIFVKRFS